MILDAHLDLSMNAMEWNRDLRMSLAQLNEVEKDLNDKPDRQKATVCFPEMRKGQISTCVATLIARYVKPGSEIPGWNSQNQAWAQINGQLAWYKSMEMEGEIRQIRTKTELQNHIDSWQTHQEEYKIGYILSLEGADSIVTPNHLEILYNQGLRAIGLSHYGPGVHAFGTDSDGPLPEKGKELLKKIEELGIILDLTHLSDTCFWEALELYSGPTWASHHLSRSITPHNRQLSDEMIMAIQKRKGKIGLAFDNWMIVPEWIRGQSTPESKAVTLEKLVDHAVHISNLAGSTEILMIGSDLDGGYGTEQCPIGISSIADMNKLKLVFEKRGFSDKEIEGIFIQNSLQFLLDNLPD